MGGWELIWLLDKHNTGLCQDEKKTPLILIVTWFKKDIIILNFNKKKLHLNSEKFFVVVVGIGFDIIF